VRIAYLILAYHQPRHVAALIAQLDTPEARFFIHVDLKSEIAPFRDAIASPHANLIDDRLPIHWGGWNMVRAMLELLRRARREAHADYYQLLSDSCVAIKSNAAIARRLDGSGANYLTISDEITPTSSFRWWVTQYHWLDLGLLNKIEKSRWGNFARRLLGPIAPRQLPRGFKLYKGSQWWCLTDACAAYVLDVVERRPDLVRFFRRTRIPDETFFHTIIGNSPFAATLSPGFAGGTQAGNHYIRWREGTPAVLGEADLDGLLRDEACFARKVNERDSASLIDRLREHLGAVPPRGLTR
jgi:hypothetical protein